MIEPIEVHVFGGKMGESIAVRLPGDLWGVVDNYTPKLDDPQTNPTLRFLQDRKVNRLCFICLTHPHLDHYRGMAYLLERFCPERIWVFGAMTHRDLCEKVAAILRLKADSTRITADDDEAAGELVRILDLIRDRYETAVIADRPDVRRLELGQQLLELRTDPPVTIDAIGVSGGQLMLYERSLQSCFDAGDNFLAERVPNVNHNRISGGLLIEYGTARIVLGADIEEEGWEETLKVFGDGGRLGSVLVKVSHHGSTNGYCEGLWQQLSPGKAAVAVITPYVSQDLPSPAGLSHVSNHARQTFVTSLSAVALATDWLREGSDTDLPAISFDVLVALRSLFPKSSRPSDRLEGRCSFLVHQDGAISHEEDGEAGLLLPSKLASR
jgi:beta-lactamase superfamily II metal-dependent hydrolase